MIRYTYYLKDYRSWLKGLGRLLDLPVVEKKINFPASIGSGYMFASNISPDISYVIMNCSFKEDLLFFRKKSADYGLNLFFLQAEVSDFFKISEQHEQLIGTKPVQNNIYLSSTNFDVEYMYSQQSKLRIVGILFSPEFLQKALKKDILLDIMVYTGQRIRNFNKEPITFEYRLILDDIFATDTQLPLSNLVLQNRILLLTEKFLSTFLEKGSSRVAGAGQKKEKQKDIHALKEVEGILSNDKLDKFPSIDVLSKTAMMSSTKLKTKFKEVYGMKLYEFYNRNRLEKAKEMLQTGTYSVKEAGLSIGFSNLSNFAKAFKKEFGILPNEMLRNK